MGGRGSGSNIIPRRGGGGGSSGGQSQQSLLVQNRTLKEAIGEKGTPKTIGAALNDVNPHFSRNYEEFQINCQRCVVAYELNRRGYDVEALPNPGDKWAQVAFRAKDGTIEARWKGAFRHAKTTNVAADRTSKVEANIEKAMKGFGPGSRGVVQVFWKNGGGHVYNVENVGGRITYIDAQGPGRQAGTFLKDAIPSKVMLIRTDNLRISNRAKEFVQTNKTR